MFLFLFIDYDESGSEDGFIKKGKAKMTPTPSIKVGVSVNEKNKLLNSLMVKVSADEPVKREYFTGVKSDFSGKPVKVYSPARMKGLQ